MTMRPRFGWFVVASLVGIGPGCAATTGVRYVYQDGDFGVVGLPENTDVPPTHYRRQAERLMAAHFPGGYQVVRAEEVVEGERTVKLEGSRTAEVAPQLPSIPLNVAKLGGASSSSQSDVVKVKECRIIYRRAGGPEKPRGYADASLTPTLYVDPNAAERRKANRDGKAPADRAGDHPAGTAANPGAASPHPPEDGDE
jgi:hypothetical protein